MLSPLLTGITPAHDPSLPPNVAQPSDFNYRPAEPRACHCGARATQHDAFAPVCDAHASKTSAPLFPYEIASYTDEALARLRAI